MSEPRWFGDWLDAYLSYSGHMEAPTSMRFWCGVSAITGAMRRKVWIDQAYFRWYANQYIILVAPPGVVSKTTTTDVAMNILREVPGVKFGPDAVTWPRLVSKFAESCETFEHPPGSGKHLAMSALTLHSGEFGNLLNPQDREMVDIYVSLWDGKQGSFKKETKTSGNDEVINPWINMIGCTTPAWIAGSFPEYMIGGGFTSRCVFIYADKKEKRVAYPKRVVPADLDTTRQKLLWDLCQISKLTGEFVLTEEAYEWGTKWYDFHIEHPPAALNDDRFGGYLARKQTHIHKLAMVLAASQSDRMEITANHLATANAMMTNLEPDMAQVFAKIGRTDDSLNAERLLKYIRAKGRVEWEEAFRYAHGSFPGLRDFENIVNGLIRARFVTYVQEGNKYFLVAIVG